MTLDFFSLATGMGLGLLLLSGGWLWFSHFKVEEGHQAILTRFGAVIRDSTLQTTTAPATIAATSHSQIPSTSSPSQTDFIEEEGSNIKLFQPGSHWKLPWDKVISFSIMERVIDLSGEKGGKYAMAADGTVLRLDSKIRFFPKTNDVYSYLFELKNPMGHIREMFTCIIRNEIANFKGESPKDTELFGSFSAIRRERKRLNEQVEWVCRDQIGASYGIQFRGVDLIDIIPPQELEVALNGIQSARTEAEILYSRAETDARQKIVAAEQGVEIAKIRAESIAMELNVLSKMVKKLLSDGNIDYYLNHRKTELVGDSKMLFMQRGDLK
jgi:regulator of protease activity HflC (stomatin/prohibitin superfamily)